MEVGAALAAGWTEEDAAGGKLGILRNSKFPGISTCFSTFQTFKAKNIGKGAACAGQNILPVETNDPDSCAVHLFVSIPATSGMQF